MSLQLSRGGETEDRSRPHSVRRTECGLFKSLQDFKPILDNFGRQGLDRRGFNTTSARTHREGLRQHTDEGMRNNRGSSSSVGHFSIGDEDTYNSPHRGYLYHHREKEKKKKRGW